MIVADKKFRPNPARAVYVQGAIDQQLVYRLTPQIVRLQDQSRDPITVYIDSPGGNLSNMEGLWALLTASNQDAAQPCRIITVVTSRAASAAADLLSSGDYAVAMPRSSILYHGSRTFREVPLTVQTTSMLAQILRVTNEKYAMELVRKIENRFMFRFLMSKHGFADIRKQNQPRSMTDAECFLAVISDSLSDRAREVFETARLRHQRYERLLAKVKKGSSGRKRTARAEAERLRAIVDFEVDSNKGNKGWSFRDGGLTTVADDFFLLNEYLASSQGERLNRLCSRYGKLSLSKADLDKLEGFPEAERAKRVVRMVRPLLEPIWAFFVALCHALQEGENELTAADAFWLGLIDEVIGQAGMPCLRSLVEYRDDEPDAGGVEPGQGDGAADAAK